MNKSSCSNRKYLNLFGIVNIYSYFHERKGFKKDSQWIIKHLFFDDWWCVGFKNLPLIKKKDFKKERKKNEIN